MIQTRTDSVPGLVRGLRLLELLAESKRGLTLFELTRSLGIPRSSAHCLLLTFERLGYLHRNEKTHRYLFGLKLFAVANMALVGLGFREEALPLLKALAEGTKLTVHLAILEGNHAVLVAKAEPSSLIRMATWVGKRMDLHSSGVGKALIAFLPEDELDRLVRELRLPRHNENTITSLRRLKANLADAKRLGYSLDDEEDEIGLRCVGCPIFDRTAKVRASISLAGTSNQINPENLSYLAAKLRETALNISRQMGFSPESQTL